jgi:putative tryptophan/tyrosine transport system substrate-binding protein
MILRLGKAMRRRDFITGIAGSAAAWPLAARAQQAGKIYRIGFLANDPTIPTQPAGQAFVDGLRESGFVEGKNVIVERRFAEGRLDRYANLATELVRLNVDVLVVSSDSAVAAAKQASGTVPIVMVNVGNPIAQGYVASFGHPGANITGLTQEDSEQVAAKRLQLLKDAIPRAALVAVLLNPDLARSQAQWQQLKLAAQSLNLALRPVEVRQASEFENAFAEIRRGRPDALFITAGGGLNFTHRRTVVELATKSVLPTISYLREITEVGGLMSYGSNRIDLFRHAAIYVVKILKGAKPADLPVEQPTKYELVINLKTARVLNLEIPRDLLLVADEVIE